VGNKLLGGGRLNEVEKIRWKVSPALSNTQRGGGGAPAPDESGSSFYNLGGNGGERGWKRHCQRGLAD